MATQVSDQLSCEWRPYLYEIICRYTKRKKKNYLKRDECYEAAYEPQDASSVPSGLNLTADIDCVCPLSV